MKANPTKGGGGAKAPVKRTMQDLRNAAKNLATKKTIARKPKPDGAKKKPAVSKTGARIYSRYGKEVPVGNPGAGVTERENVASDFIKGAKAVKSKYVN
jgi:hypothetical protein